MGACITKIPICGGFCAKTDNPETGCLRHVSNEVTLPQPFLYPHVCRAVVEHSACCRCFGRVGCLAAERLRAPVMITAFICSLLAGLLMMLSALAMSKSESALERWAWVSASLEGPLGKVEIHVGISAILVQNNSFPAQVLSWDDADCGYFAGAAAYKEACLSCKDVSTGTASFIVISLLTQIVQITTDLQRSTPFGDVNCQKMMGFATSMLGMFSGLIALTTFASVPRGVRTSTNPAHQSAWICVTARLSRTHVRDTIRVP